MTLTKAHLATLHGTFSDTPFFATHAASVWGCDTLTAEALLVTGSKAGYVLRVGSSYKIVCWL